MAPNDAEPGTGGLVVRLGENFEIIADQPLDELRSPGAAAYACTDRDQATDELFALVCDPKLPPRLDVIERLNSLQIESLLTPHAWGVLDWPIAKRRSFAIVFPRPGGPRLVATLAETIAPISADELVRSILPALVVGLRGLDSTGVAHRAIRPTNLFFHSAASRLLVLGDCVSAPAGSAQPIAYETIEGGMANPCGRGPGTLADDMYALGVTLVFLMLGRDPTLEINEQELLNDKINRGSFNAIVGGYRLPPEMIEAIRGLLADDPRERWTLPALENWLQGRRLPPKQTSLAKRATRPFEFQSGGFYTARGLAHAFSRDPVAAARAIKGADFEIWMQRSLSDRDRTEALATTRSDSNDAAASATHDMRLVGRVCIALDPLAPIRYDRFAAAIDGFGPALVAAFAGQGLASSIAEAMVGRLPQFWFSAQATLRPEHAAWLKTFEQLNSFLDDRRPGFGLERVLYELNPELHCLSSSLEAEYVVDVGEVLAALERVAASGAASETLLDRHLAAFIAARFRNGGAEWLERLGSSDPKERVLGSLQVLARLQAFRGPVSCPALAEWVNRQLTPIIDRFHNRRRRVTIKSQATKLASKGGLGELLALVSSGAERSNDLQGFLAAQREYLAIDRALGLLRGDASARPAHALQVAGRFSVIVACLLFGLSAVGTVVLMR